MNDVDKACALLGRELAGVRKSDARFKRQCERRGRYILALLDQQDRLRHEIVRLQKALVEVHKYPHAAQEIVERTVPRALGRDT